MNVLLTKVNRVPSVQIVPRRDKKHSDRGYYLNSTDIKIKEYIKRKKKPYIMVNPQVRLLLDGKNDKNKIIENVEYARTNCFTCSRGGIGIKIVRRVRTNGMCRCIMSAEGRGKIKSVVIPSARLFYRPFGRASTTGYTS